MVARNKVEKRRISKKDSTYDNLYVCMYEATTKRKYLLSAIKNSLIMQDELERISFFRAEKTEIANSIKKKLIELNTTYQNLKVLLPNVKNVISYTEKELGELDTQVNSLRKDIKIDNEKIYVNESLENSIIEGELSTKKKLLNVEKRKDFRKVSKLEGDYKSKANLSRIDRIKNNLDVIEAKLKYI